MKETGICPRSVPAIFPVFGNGFATVKVSLIPPIVKITFCLIPIVVGVVPRTFIVCPFDIFPIAFVQLPLSILYSPPETLILVCVKVDNPEIVADGVIERTFVRVHIGRVGREPTAVERPGLDVVRLR